LNNQNIKKRFQELISVNYGLAEILNKTNRFESSLDILLGVFDQGVIAISTQGDIFSCNDKAKDIMGFVNQDVLSQNGLELFPMIPFEEVLEKEIAIPEKLYQIGGYDVIVSVNPIIHSEKKLGAVAFIKRFNEEERKQHAIRSQIIGKGHKAKYRFDDILGNSQGIIKCKDSAVSMAKSDSSILIMGESGTGKEMFAQAIHNESKRKAFQFVAVNCGALSESLLESELFGYEEGAFTGARKGGKPGLFELAHQGTLFLDEIGDMPYDLQKSLLRVLQEREIMRLGGDRLIHVDVRLIAATNRDLKQLVKEGRFREDLYYRLHVLPLFIPPLRSRKEDVLVLINGMKAQFKWDFDLTIEGEQTLMDHCWRGNIRELRNCIEYISNLQIKKVESSDLPLEIEENVSNQKPIVPESKSLLIDEINRAAGKSIHRYVFVLEELEKAFKNKKRAGRRSIYLTAMEREIFISEQEIRTIFNELERLDLVEVFAGRGGTVITEKGRNVFTTLAENHRQTDSQKDCNA
jgi:transcriptional regulator with PAS, ATPase and Fis domain